MGKQDKLGHRGGGVYVVRTSGSAYCNKKKFYSGPTLDCLLYVLHMFCSTSYSQLESILHFHTQRSLNGSQYKIGGRPRGEGVLEYGQYQTKGGRGIEKFSFWPDVLCEWPLSKVRKFELSTPFRLA